MAPPQRRLALALALVCLSAAASSAVAAGSSLPQSSPRVRQFLQLAVSLNGTCSNVLAAEPTLANDMRRAAINDVRLQLIANKTGIADLNATLSSLRGAPVNCAPVMVRVGARPVPFT